MSNPNASQMSRYFLALPRYMLVLAGSAVALSIGQAQAAVMRPGTWQIETHFVSTKGPASVPRTGPNPLVTKVCMERTFVEKENYSNPEFSLGRLRRLGFDCQITEKVGGHTEASWRYACSRSDKFAIQSAIEVKVGETTLHQHTTETTIQYGQVQSDSSVRVEASLVSDQCAVGLQRLR
jgi:hypothetical protein